jgi:hypothetical protein
VMTSSGLPIASTADFSECPEDLMCCSCRAASRVACAHERRGATPQEAGGALKRDVMLASAREAAARAAERLVQ